MKGYNASSKASWLARSGLSTLVGWLALLIVAMALLANRQYVFYDYGGSNDSPHSLTGCQGSTGSATSGSLFTAEKVHLFHQDWLSTTAHRLSSSLTLPGPACPQWAVVTTIFEVSPAITKLLHPEGKWCVVIVGDNKTPDPYVLPKDSTDLSRVVFLGVEDQRRMEQEIPFLNQLPWNHFGRKNVGYLYAILKGAEYIWDFDDDNTILGKNLPTPQDSGEANMEVMVVPNHNFPVLNPYPIFGAPHSPSWPRGQPLEYIKEAASYNNDLVAQNLAIGSVGVIQSLANHDPDVDAVYRLSQPIPFNFTVDTGNSVRYLAIPKGVRAPFNAQASMWSKSCFWGLILPVTVHGRVSDIWRSYYTQRLMDEVGKTLLFSQPLVIQERNPHNYLADFSAESQLYLQSKGLVHFLNQWKPKSRKSFLAVAKELAIEFYERDFWGLDDVKLIHLWLDTLSAVGYRPPNLI